MRALRWMGVLAVVAATAVPAHGAAPDAVGWWWRAQSGMVLEVPAPPTAPEGGLVVSAGPDGPTAVGAVRFVLAADEQPLTLRLDVDGSIGMAAVLACPAALPWQPAEGGRWDARPTVDCDRARTSGVESEDGTSWSFDMTGFADAGVLDVVLMPETAEGEVQPRAFELRFTAPARDALTVAPPPAPDPDPGPDPEPTPTTTEFRPQPPPPPGRPAAPPAAPDETATDPDEPVVAGPAPTATPDDDAQSAPTTSARVSTTDPDPNDAATAAAAVLLVAAGFLWSFRTREAAHATTRGLSRWRSPRTGPPPPLL